METAWLIEKQNRETGIPMFWGWEHWGWDTDLSQPTWTHNHLKAMRFARKEDAEMLMKSEGYDEWKKTEEYRLFDIKVMQHRDGDLTLE